MILQSLHGAERTVLGAKYEEETIARERRIVRVLNALGVIYQGTMSQREMAGGNRPVPRESTHQLLAKRLKLTFV